MRLSASAQKTELLVYTALETDQLKAYTESFQKTNPNIDLKFVRDSTGVITAKLLAEKANPQADAILGVAASSMEIFKAEGMLAGYFDVDQLYDWTLGYATHHLAYDRLDAPEFYWAMRRVADAYPDAKTGQNTALSSAITIDMSSGRSFYQRRPERYPREKKEFQRLVEKPA